MLYEIPAFQRFSELLAAGGKIMAKPTHANSESERMGWPTGLEPATARTTIWGSTIELRPPTANTLDFRPPNVKFRAVKEIL
jgi:hypothetical protein